MPAACSWRRRISISTKSSTTCQPAAHQGAGKKLVLEYVVATDVPHSLRGDTLRLSQVLINLVGNAIKFTDQGGVTVHIDCLEHGADQAVLQFRIADTGIGMSAEQQAQLFQAFTQADTSITRKHGGTGLGLVITKRLIEKMGGTIAVDSTPEVGSTFTFQLPLARGESAETPQAVTNCRFLVVDDNELARRVLARLLQKQRLYGRNRRFGQRGPDPPAHRRARLRLRDDRPQHARHRWPGPGRHAAPSSASAPTW